MGVPKPGTPCRILVVDDNADSAEMLKLFLETLGHDVQVAGEGVSALAVNASFDAEVGLFDIGLPGMSGYDLARRVREDPKARDMYLIAVTGWGQEDDRRLAREAGFDAHVTKPADPGELERVIAGARRRGMN
jgi:CheY-like chemotaxis protein